MKLGIFITSVGIPSDIEGQIQQAIDIENEGFDSFWRAQTFGIDALTLFSLIGQRTSRIRMGTAVIPTFPRHPVVLAQQVLTTQEATRGRVTLGIGLSHKPVIEGNFGLSFNRPALHMKEFLSVLRPLIQDHRVDFKGEAFTVDAELTRINANSVPVVIAALGPRMLRVAGEMADGTVTWMVGRKTLATNIVPRIREAAGNAGRPEPKIYVGVPVAVTDDVNTGIADAAIHFQRYGKLPSYRRMLDIEGVEHPEDIAIIGNEMEVERQIREYASAGTTELLAAPFPTGNDELASLTRTRTHLKHLVGKI